MRVSYTSMHIYYTHSHAREDAEPYIRTLTNTWWPIYCYLWRKPVINIHAYFNLLLLLWWISSANGILFLCKSMAALVNALNGNYLEFPQYSILWDDIFQLQFNDKLFIYFFQNWRSETCYLGNFLERPRRVNEVTKWLL